MKFFDVWARRAALAFITFFFYIGGRRIGKTYSYLLGHYERYRNGEAGKLIYLRLTKREFDEMYDPDNNPYNDINKDHNYEIVLEPNGEDCLAIVDKQNENEIIGIVRPLSAFKNLRGVSFSAYSEIYFDEFIPTEHVRKTAEIKKAGWLFSQAYETINSNRELFGLPPVIVTMTANAFSIDSSILSYFDLQKAIAHMQKTGQARLTDKDRGIYVELCEPSEEFIEAKKQTALYKALGKRNDLTRVNLENKFGDKKLTQVAKIRYTEYVPIVSLIGQYTFTVYAHKSNGKLFIAAREDSARKKYNDENMRRFCRDYYSYLTANMNDGNIAFDNVDTAFSFSEMLDELKRKPW